MADSNQSKNEAKAFKTTEEKGSKAQATKSRDTPKGEVLLNLPAGLKYRMPGQRQRVLIGSIVVGLNVLLVLAVVLYFYNPAFQDFIYNVGRE